MYIVKNILDFIYEIFLQTTRDIFIYFLPNCPIVCLFCFVLLFVVAILLFVFLFVCLFVCFCFLPCVMLYNYIWYYHDLSTSGFVFLIVIIKRYFDKVKVLYIITKILNSMKLYCYLLV